MTDGSRRTHPVEAAYRAGLVLMPPHVRRADGDAIVSTLADQLDAQSGAWARWRVGLRALRRLPRAIAGHWMDAWRPARVGRSGRNGPHGTGRGGDGMGRITRELAQVIRGLAKAPTFAVATIVLIGLGAGTVTTVYTIVDDVLLQPLPYPAQDRLVYLTNGSHNGPTLDRLPDVDAFEMWAVTSGKQVNLMRPEGTPLGMTQAEVTPSYFTMFGARPHLGRLLTDADADDRSIAVLSYTAWRDVWGADPDLVGRTVLLDGQPREIVGVLAEDFNPPGSVGWQGVDLYAPVWWSNPTLDQPGYHAHTVVARLRPGATIEQAQVEIDEVMQAVADAHPDYYEEGPEEKPLVTLQEQAVGDVRTGLLLLLSAVGLLMLVACANVAHLFMARALGRDREIAIRRAMGAGTGDIVRRLALEAVAIGAAGGALALGIAIAGLAAFERWTVQLPRGTDISLDGGIFAVGILLATGTALVFGVGPVLRLVGRDVQDTLRGGGQGITGGRGVRALRGGLIVAEVAISLVLVTGAGLLMRSFSTVTSQDPGIDADGVRMVVLNPTGLDEAEPYVTRMHAVDRALERVPGVQSAGWAMAAPFQFVGGDACCWGNRIGEGDDALRIRMHTVGGDWWETLGTRIVAGAAWDPDRVAFDMADMPVVISEELAIRMFGSAEAALGRVLEDITHDPVVVGVAEPVLWYGLDQPHEFAVYLPPEALTFGIPMATFALRTSGALPDDFGRLVREAIWSVEPELPVPSIESVEDWIDDSSGTRRFGSLLFSVFGSIALLLAAAGLSGTLLYSVSRQRRELGIRMALGAGRRRTQAQVVGRGMAVAGTGVAVGVALAWYLSRFLEAWLYGVSPTDPMAIAGSAVVLLLTAGVACWIPAWRASRTDPLETLKAE